MEKTTLPKLIPGERIILKAHELSVAEIELGDL